MLELCCCSSGAVLVLVFSFVVVVMGGACLLPKGKRSRGAGAQPAALVSYKICAMMIYNYNCRFFIFVFVLCLIKLVLS
jgi:hypothetical protein